MHVQLKLTTLLNKNARPVAPVNLVLNNCVRFVNGVSQLAQTYKRWPPICFKNTLPIILVLYYSNL
ncbi:hypothetical protein DERP_010536 [Dermatophagoides pteronyssinus]|uniref:Uncharacterized protein n=1 Tax=Dermatophagoides pteronyssinus TaxID=6956 RepID=A0ABQ8JFK8_DERPT|nr:hypothetical protein DERP_010536 [Dermatophagoides pteronyssinus]